MTDGPGAVMVAYDGARSSRRALALACDLAAVEDRVVRVVVSVRRSPRYGETMAETREAFSRAEQATRRLRREVEAHCEDRGVAVQVTVRPGGAAAELRRAVRKDPGAFIVVAGPGFRAGLLRLSLLPRGRGHRRLVVFVPASGT